MYKYILLLIFVLLLVPFVFADEQEVFVLTLKYDGENLTKDGLYVTRANYFEELVQEGTFLLEIISFDDEVLYSRNFDIPMEFSYVADPTWFDEQGNQIVIPIAEEKKLDVAYKELILPYFTHSEKIVISRDRTNLLEISTVHLARTCGDNVCQEHENDLNCEFDCKEDISNKTIFYILLVVILFLIIGIIFRRRKNV